MGEGEAGKTTLAKKIENPDYQLNPEEKSTEGIDIIQWYFPYKERTFRVNIWDFGGQEIYHATHQFFLTKRSLYALVADTRKKDTDFYYWLNVIELLTENSPLLIVKNEKGDRQRQINERALRGQFTNLKETLATNLATNRGLQNILDNIQYYISHLPHVGSALPKTWKRVREVLEQDERNYISRDEYFNICQKNNFTKREDQLQLSGYLQDLGVCLHFQEDDLLGKTVILKPEWGTAAVYKVLDDEQVINNLGKFTKSDLRNIWSEEKYADMQPELLQLMIKFKLCYKIPGTDDTYVAPQLLTENQPDYKWDETNNLILRYAYEFMPKGIITQFIVIMHKYIDQQQYVWKSGVILDKDNTKAEVIEYYSKREIKIRTSGAHQRYLMTIISYELDEINNSYKRLKYNKLIPCNCEECQGSQEPHFYPFKTLQNLINKTGYVQCQNSGLMVNILSLIDDVVDLKQLIKDEEIETDREKQYLREIAKILASRPIKAEAKVVASGGDIYNQEKVGIGHMSGGTIEKGVKVAGVINEAEQKNLAEAAADIQALLVQLSQTNPTQTLSQKAVVAEEAIELIENDPTLKERVVSAIKAMGVEAFMELIDHPVANVLRAGIEGFKEPYS